MTELTRICEELERAYEGDGAWHGPSLLGSLSGVTAGQAVRRPVDGGHSIWEIVLHLTAWRSIVRRRLAGERLTLIPAALDWARVEREDAAGWRDALSSLQTAQNAILELLRSLDDTVLDRVLEGEAGTRHTAYQTLHGLAQHDAYHAGQIMLLRRAQGS